MGNRTSCCTAIIDGANGKATPIYLVNTAFNVVQLKDEDNNIVGMSRVFVGEVDKKPAMIIENIELNNTFIKDKTPEELTQIRNNMFDYIKEFSSSVSKGKGMSVYFSKNYTNVPLDDLKSTEKTVDFVGEISSDSIYLNCKPGWVEPKELKSEPCRFYIVN